MLRRLSFDGHVEQEQEAWALAYTAFNYVDRMGNPMVPAGTGARLDAVMEINKFFKASGKPGDTTGTRTLKTTGVSEMYVENEAYDILVGAMKDYVAQRGHPTQADSIKFALDHVEAFIEITAA